jgi:hypothetical protein
MSRSNSDANLRRLLEELEALGLPNSGNTATLLANRISEDLPLAHSTSAANFAAVCGSGRLLSPKILDTKGIKTLKPDAVEIVLGTSPFVFLYAAPFSFPSSGCGLLFERTLEVWHSSDGVATPFDSGGLIDYFVRPDMTESPQDFFLRHQLPLPEHREYLRACIGKLFGDPFDYLNGCDPVRSCPIGLSGGDRRRWTHEIRIPEEVIIRSPHLKAVFVPRRLGLEPQVKSLLSWCHSEGFDVEVFDSDRQNDFAKLRNACLEYLQKLLN